MPLHGSGCACPRCVADGAGSAPLCSHGWVKGRCVNCDGIDALEEPVEEKCNCHFIEGTDGEWGVCVLHAEMVRQLTDPVHKQLAEARADQERTVNGLHDYVVSTENAMRNYRRCRERLKVANYRLREANRQRRGTKRAFFRLRQELDEARKLLRDAVGSPSLGTCAQFIDWNVRRNDFLKGQA